LRKVWENDKTVFPPFPQTLEIAPRFPHSLPLRLIISIQFSKPKRSLPQLPNPLTFRLIFQLEKTEREKIILVTMAALCYLIIAQGSDRRCCRLILNQSSWTERGHRAGGSIPGARDINIDELKPPSHLPPWKDPETLDLALFGLFAPLGLVTAFVAAVRGASKWVVLPLLVALSILTLVGFMEAMSV